MASIIPTKQIKYSGKLIPMLPILAVSAGYNKPIKIGDKDYKIKVGITYTPSIMGENGETSEIMSTGVNIISDF